MPYLPDRQQDVNRARAAVGGPCGCERRDVLDLAQPVVDDQLQHRAPGTRTQALAVNDTHAAQAAMHAIVQELPQGLVRRMLPQPVQVDLGLDCKLAPLQFAHHFIAYVRAAKRQLVVGAEHRRIGRNRMAFVQQVPAPGARRSGNRSRARLRRCGGALGQWAHAGHRTPEGVRVVVTRRRGSSRHAVGVRFRGGLGFQYSCAAFVANPATAGALMTIRSHAT